jgi:hypothetical protein
MTLEFEKLTADVESMAQNVYERQKVHDLLLDRALAKLRAHAEAWQRVDYCVKQAIDQVGLKELRAARPLDEKEPLDAAIDPPPAPDQGTIVAVDGSQIMPNRHGAFLYSLINIGILVYYHGSAAPPQQYTVPALDYPGRDEDQDFEDRAALVSLRRDQAEIESLAQAVHAQIQAPRPLLALLDQRLLYWPAVGANDSEGQRVLLAWQQAISDMRGQGAHLAGYIARSRKQSVLTMLDALDIDEPDFDMDRLTKRDQTLGLSDGALFARLLDPGQRSKVYVDVSQHNEDFSRRDAMNEICFFYFNPGPGGRQIARVDIPISVAQDAQAVSDIHALLHEQCLYLGQYPYALTRADEIAVVGRRDQEHLDVMIENAMQRHGLSRSATAKQQTKGIARAGKTRHEL